MEHLVHIYTHSVLNECVLRNLRARAQGWGSDRASASLPGLLKFAETGTVVCASIGSQGDQGATARPRGRATHTKAGCGWLPSLSKRGRRSLQVLKLLDTKAASNQLHRCPAMEFTIHRFSRRFSDNGRFSPRRDQLMVRPSATRPTEQPPAP